MLSFLFWNLNGNDSNDCAEAIRLRIGRMAKHFDVDIFIFAESRFEPKDAVELLCGMDVGKYRHSASECHRIQIFSRLSAEKLKPQHDSVDGRMTIRQIDMPPNKILIAAVHMPSQLRQDVQSISFYSTTMQNDIAAVEKSLDNYHTLVVGDMNMNPFDDGMIAAQAFHGVMTKRIAKTKKRVVSGVPYRFFFNPMWGFFGDRTRTPGTYFYSAGSSIEYFWQMFDQVLVRPELMDRLDDLRILDSDGEVSFLNHAGRPDRNTASDHLPILFRLRIEPSEVRK